MYQPKITDENVRKLFYLKCERNKPMTFLVNEILNQYFTKKGALGDEEQTTLHED